jgi:hypothetical protein
VIDDLGLDTALARLLHAQGRLDLAVLRSCLSETRAERSQHGRTLARVLVGRGVLTELEALATLARLRAADDALPDSETAGGPPKRRTGTISSGLHASLASGELGPAWRPGFRVGDYRILEPLGQGGMGVVFLGEHVVTGARYAVKTIPDTADAGQIDRLKREGEALASVPPHPNVVRIHSLGHAYGRLYLIMDVVTGGTLEARCKNGPLPVVEAARVVRGLALGIGAMHEKGILHRDVKPSNVLFDDEGTPKIVDFGLALLGGANRLTRTGEMLGTPSYMAPEQVLTDRDRMGPWTDVYGLGGVLYHALVGEPPFKGRGIAEVLTQVVQDAPRAPRAIRPEVPPELDALCLRALAKDPADRPTSAQLAGALLPFLEEARPLKARPRPVWALFPAGLLLLLLASPFAFFRQRAKAPEAQPAHAADSAFVAPVPSAAKPKPRAAFAWRYEPGKTVHVALATQFDFGMAGFAREQRQKLGFSLRADRGSGSAPLVLQGMIESIEVHSAIEIGRGVTTGSALGGRFRPFDFDSTQPGHESSPLDAAIGKSFSFALEPTTGLVSSMTGVSEINEQIMAAVEDDPQREHYRTVLSSDDGFRLALDAVLHLVPPGGAVPGWPWERDIPSAFGDDLKMHVPAVHAGFESTVASGEESIDVKWSGEAGAEQLHRKVQGSATFGLERLVHSQVDEDYRTGALPNAPEGLTGHMTIEWVEVDR